MRGCPFCGAPAQMVSTEFVCSGCSAVVRFAICSVTSHAARLWDARPSPSEDVARGASQMFDYIKNGGDEVALLKAQLEHMGGALEREIELCRKAESDVARLEAENANLRRWKALDKPLTAAMAIANGTTAKLRADAARLRAELERKDAEIARNKARISTRQAVIETQRNRISELHARAALIGTGDGWREIESAPKDGREIEVKYLTDDPRRVRWAQSRFGTTWHLTSAFTGVPLKFEPTHWRFPPSGRETKTGDAK